MPKDLLWHQVHGRQMMLAIAKVEAMTNGIANISNEINDTLGDGYMQAVQDYREAAFDAYEMVNEGYENYLMT